MKRTARQSKIFYTLLKKLGIDADNKAAMVLSVSNGRTEHSSELSAEEMAILINRLQQLYRQTEQYRYDRVLNNTRWRLIYTMRDKGMALPDGTPDYERIHRYTQHYWGKHINKMTLTELNRYIGVVNHWKKLKEHATNKGSESNTQ